MWLPHFVPGLAESTADLVEWPSQAHDAALTHADPVAPFKQLH